MYKRQDGGNNRVGIGSTGSIGGTQLNVLGAAGTFNQVAVGSSSANNSIAIGNHTSGDVVSNLITSSSKFGGLIQGGDNGNFVLGVRDNDTTDGLFVITGAGDQTTNDYSRLRLSITPNNFIVNESGVDADFRVESDSNANMLFVDAGTNRVGVGTNSFSTHEVFKVGTNQIIPIRAESSGGETILSLKSTSTNGRDYMVISGGSSGSFAGGNFGIFDATATKVRMKIGPGGGVIFNEDSTDSDFRVESDSNAHMLFVDGGNNNLLIGNTVVNPASGFSAIAGFGYAASGQVQIAATSNLATLVLGQNQGTNGSIVDFRKQGTIVGTISVTGSATAYNTSSDQRLKQNIQDADDAGSSIDAIQVRKFDWIDSGDHQPYGMVAQELQTVAPEAVSAPEDPDEMMGVDYSKLVPMLVKEIQTLRNRVAQLENN